MVIKKEILYERYCQDILNTKNYSVNNIFEILLPLFSKLIHYYASRYFAKGESQDDLYQQGLIGLYKAIISFKFGENNNFDYHARRCIKLNILNLVRASNSKKVKFNYEAVSLDAPYSTDNQGTENNVNYYSLIPASSITDPIDILVLIETATEARHHLEITLSDREYNVLGCYLDGLSYKEIALKLNITEKSVDNTLTRVKIKLNKLKRKLG